MSYLVVPSDITLLERKCCNGLKKLSFFENLGVATMFPMYHNNYSKLSSSEMKAVLQKKYPDGKSEELEICKTRQAAVSRAAVSHVGFWAGAGGLGFSTFWSFRKYNYQSKLILLPFLAYAGGLVGRACGDVLSGRNGETYRDRFLGGLPANVYYNGGE